MDLLDLLELLEDLEDKDHKVLKDLLDEKDRWDVKENEDHKDPRAIKETRVIVGKGLHGNRFRKQNATNFEAVLDRKDLEEKRVIEDPKASQDHKDLWDRKDPKVILDPLDLESIPGTRISVIV